MSSHCNDRGATLLKLDRFSEAVAAYNNVLAIAPENTNALYEKGLALSHLGLYKDAVDVFEEVIEQNPALVDAWLLQG